MQFFSRFASGRRTTFAARAAFALSAALCLPDQQRTAAAADVPEVGVWIDHDGKGAIEIKPCGPALCGNIVWIKNPVNDQGQPLFDRRNPDEAKRNRPICGLPVIGNLRRMSDGWDEGWIYSPEEGSQYDLALKAASKDKLVVTGYKGVKLFSKTFTWTRAPADFQKCAGASETKAKPPVPTPKVAAPKPGDDKAVARKPAVNATAPATSDPALKKPAAAPAVAKSGAAPATKTTAAPATKPAQKSAAAPPAAAKKTAAQAAAPKANASAKAVAKPQPVSTTAAAGQGQVKKTEAKKSDAKKTAATRASSGQSALVPPKPTAAKKPATAANTADTGASSGDPSERKIAPKVPVKKQTAEEDEASSAAD